MAVLLFLITFAHAQTVSNIDIPNFHQTNKNIYRGGRPLEKGLMDLWAQGIKTDLDLENDMDAIADEKEGAEHLGIKFISLPMSGFWKPEDATVNAALSALNNPANYPIFIHCQHGQDRTGVVVGLYRVLSENWTPQRAYSEMLGIGFHRTLFLLDQYYRERTGLDDLFLLNYKQ